MREDESLRTAAAVLAAFLALGIALNILIPLRGPDQAFLMFLAAAPLRLAVFGLLLWIDRRRGAKTPFDFSGPLPRALSCAALMLALWLVFLTQARGAPWGWVERALALPACLAVGLFEEYLFRGLLLDGLLARTGPMKALLGSALLFTFYHTRPQAVLAWPHIFLTGAVFANLRLRGLSLGHLALIHAAADFLFFFHGKDSVREYGTAYWVFLGGLFTYAVFSLPSVTAPGMKQR